MLSEQDLALVRLRSKGYMDESMYLLQMDEMNMKPRELNKAVESEQDQPGIHESISLRGGREVIQQYPRPNASLRSSKPAGTIGTIPQPPRIPYPMVPTYLLKPRK